MVRELITRLATRALALSVVLASNTLVAIAADKVPDGTGDVSGPFPMSTSQFFPQIVETPANTVRRPRNPKIKPAIEVGPDNGLRVLSSVTDTRTEIQTKFPGITFTGFTPPDPNIAVGFSHVVQVVNSDVAFFSKTGSKQFQQSLDNNGFFSGVAQTNFVFDPKCIYDQGSNRYFVIALEQDDNTQNSGILLAVSDDSNPNGNWTRYRIDSKANIGGTMHWFDYPGLGYNRHGLVITGNLFTFNSNSFGGARSYVIQKPALLTGGTASFFFFNHSNLFTIQPGRTLENVTNTAFGVSIKNTSTFTFSSWRNINTTPLYAQVDVAIPPFIRFLSDATSTGGATLDPVSDRMMDSAFRSGFMVCTHTVRFSSTDNRAMIRWYEFKMNNWPSSGAPTRRQSGNVGLAAPNHLFMPAISRNGVGAISIVLTRSSNTRTADLYALSHKSTDALNTMGPLSAITSSLGSAPAGSNRWGDYFSISIDPADPKRFWACGMVLRADGLWRTEFATWFVP